MPPRLEVLHGFPVMLEEDDAVGGGEVQTEAADGALAEHHPDGRVAG
jgi:hypothetical protein